MTKYAPYELWMGYIPRAHQLEHIGPVPKIEEQKEQLEKIRNQAQEAMKRAQSMWRKDKEWTEYQVDQKVWLEAKNIKTTQPMTKLRALRYGPFKVINKLGPVTYQLMLPKGWKIHNVFHASLLLPYKEMEEHGTNFEEPPLELIEGEEEYEVEEIRDKRKKRNKTEYLIKWKGYSEAENTWVRAEDVHAPELLAQYHQRRSVTIRVGRVLKSKGRNKPGHAQVSVPHRNPSDMSSMPSTSAAQGPIDLSPSLSPPPNQICTGENPSDVHASPQSPTVLPDVSGLHLQAQSQQTSTFFIPENIPHSQTMYYDIGNQPLGDQEQMQEDGGDGDSRAASSLGVSNVDHPEFPWVKAVEGYSAIDIPGEDHQFHHAKYEHFGLMDGEPTIWGTDGGPGEVAQYAEHLTAQQSEIPSGTFVDDRDLSCFDLDQLFARGELWAIEILDDFGIIADVHRLQCCAIKERLLEKYKGVLDRQRTALDREYAQYLLECDHNSKEAKQARGHLAEAKVRTRTTPFVDQGVYLGEGLDWVKDALQTRLTLARRHLDPPVRKERAPHMGPA